MQTSIEWLVDNINRINARGYSGYIEVLASEAKIMHKIELENAYKAGSLSLVDDDSFEQYYQEKFKKDYL
jgi:hypothetical protein